MSESNQADKIDPREVMIWNNSELKIGGKTIFLHILVWGTRRKSQTSFIHQQWRVDQRKVDQRKIKVSFSTYYSLLRAIKSRWKIHPPQKQKQPRTQSWLDVEDNLSNGALFKIIVKGKFQPPNNENRILSYGVSHSDMSKIYN